MNTKKITIIDRTVFFGIGIRPQIAILLVFLGTWLLSCTGNKKVVSNEFAPIENNKLISITNNYSFPITENIKFPIYFSESLAKKVDKTIPNIENFNYYPFQIEREQKKTFAWLNVELAPGESRSFKLSRNINKPKPNLKVEVVGHYPSGLPSHFLIKNGLSLPLFDLSTVEIVKGLDDFSENREERIRKALSHNDSKLLFKEIGRHAGPVMNVFRFQGKGGEFNDYEVKVDYRVFDSGIVDVDITLRSTKVREPKAYLALAKKIVTDAPNAATIRWKGKLITIEADRASPPRSNRMEAWGRDVSWVGLQGKGTKTTQAILADFTPNLTRMNKGRIRNANDYLVNEYLVGLGNTWVLLAEISRENDDMGKYIPNQFVVPSDGETIELHYRLLHPAHREMQSIDDAFNSFAGYQGVSHQNDQLQIDFGVQGVSFGTSYFPHSTFAENFEYWHSAGMSGQFRPVDKWWPMFKYWEFFKGEIRRDMRIVNAMGLEWIRIHHFDAPDFREDYLTTPEGGWMLEYINFMAETARESSLRLFLDFSLSPNDAALIAERFGDVIDFYEIQNEVLIIPGASVDRFEYWREIRKRILDKQPKAKVFLTGGPQFFAIYDRLLKEGVQNDAVGQHAYVDNRETPTIFRDFAVSLGGYASQSNRFPLNSEYNWRMITRDTEEEQATHFSEISNYLLSQHAIPLLLQFQFQETFAVPPRNRGALRHYELLRIDRTPKPQALAYVDLIKQYGREGNRLKQLEINIGEVDIKRGSPFTYKVRLHNLTSSNLTISISPELPKGFKSNNPDTSYLLEPDEEIVLKRSAISPDDLVPGVYHFFEKVQYNNQFHYGWGFARYIGHPRLDLEAPVLDGVLYYGGLGILDKIDLSSFSYVVFGEEAPSLEVSWALYIYQSLRSATGADINRAKHTFIDSTRYNSNMILVGNASSNPLIARIVDHLPLEEKDLSPGEGMVLTIPNPLGQGTLLLITGGDPEGVQKAASDFIYRYWRYAKDAVSFREGMPSIESDWIKTKASENDVQEIFLKGPSVGVVDERIHIVVLEQAEPPGPVADIAISVYLDGKKIESIKSNSSGEVAFLLRLPGLYEIRPEGVRGESIQVRVKSKLKKINVE
jgi:hypothetical protein